MTLNVNVNVNVNVNMNVKCDDVPRYLDFQSFPLARIGLGRDGGGSVSYERRKAGELKGTS